MNEQITIRPPSTHQLRDLADAADVLDPVGLGEAEVAVEPVADIVAIEQHGVAAERKQLLVDDVGDRRLAGARQSGEPDDAGLLVLQRGAFGLADRQRLPGDVGGAAQREGDHPGRDRPVGVAVDHDEGAGLAVRLIGDRTPTG